MVKSPMNKGFFLARTLAEYARPPTRMRAGAGAPARAPLRARSEGERECPLIITPLG